MVRIHQRAPSHACAKGGDFIDGERVNLLSGGSLGNGPAINDAGTVTFVNFFDGNFGVLTESALVVKPGDVIDGRTLRSVARNRPPVINIGG